MTTFENATYRTQIHRLRNLALEAVSRYPIKLQRMELINHGENATFRAYSRSGASYLLRIHRSDYHTTAAISEELRWLESLAKNTELVVPNPLRSLGGRLVETVTTDQFPRGRQVCVFKWIEGRFIHKSLSSAHMYQLGQVIATLQAHARRRKSEERRYWCAHGLVGRNPTFGSIDALTCASKGDQSVISDAKRSVFKRLKSYQLKYPNRMGLIHADLHFGNLLRVDRGGIGVIDFDDCGVGFHAYDLVIPLLSAGHILKSRGESKKLPIYQEELIKGYSTGMPWDQEDGKILKELLTARKLVMLGWLQSRSDNPKLAAHLKKAVKSVAKQLKE